jgi:hypothetical protein
MRRGTDDELDGLADQLDRAFTSLAGSLDRQARHRERRARAAQSCRWCATRRGRADMTGRARSTAASSTTCGTALRGRIVEPAAQLARLTATARGRVSGGRPDRGRARRVRDGTPGALVRNGSGTSVRGQVNS